MHFGRSRLNQRKRFSLGSLIDAQYFFSQVCLGQLAVRVSVWKGIHRLKRGLGLEDPS
jgi:hypothetical protein